MIKIFQYECKRLLWNKFFFGLLLILLLYGWQVLNGVTISGVSHTAPFSPWSFGDYLSRMISLLWIGALFFLTFFTSGKAQRADILTDAAPVSPRRYALARCAAALIGTVLLALVCIAETAFFYGQYFSWYSWGQTDFPGFDHIGSGADICTRERLAVGSDPTLAGLCMDVSSLRVHGPTIA